MAHVFTAIEAGLEFVDRVSAVFSGVLALLATGFAALIWVLRVSPRVRTRLVTSHLRRPRFGGADSAVRDVTNDAAKRFRRTARLIAAGEQITPADGVERAIPAMLDEDPWAAEFQGLLAWCEYVQRPGRESLFGRLVAPDQVALVRSFVTAVIDYVHEFARLGLASQAESPATAAFLAELSGAAILADSSRSRSGVASSVLVRHSTRYRDSSDLRAGNTGRLQGGLDDWRRYEDDHVMGGQVEHRDGEQLGDYDGRLPDLHGVGVATSLIDGAVTFVLDTTETCYRASEDADGIGCKKLVSASDDPTTPRFEPTRPGWLARRDASEQRVSILTTYVSLIARGSSDPEALYGLRADAAPPEVLVLCRRSRATNNGQGTLSATAGGLVELGADGSVDVDGHGAPDPLAAAIRECREEIGVALERHSVNPVSVFTCTIQGRDDDGTTMTERGKGQLVSVVLSLAAVPLTMVELRSASALADQARGGFEVDELNGLAMYPGNAGCHDFARTVSLLSADLDQHGLLSCFYASARAYGVETTVRAFTDAFEDPWWRQSWSTETSAPRLCRDPRDVRPLPHFGEAWGSTKPILATTPDAHSAGVGGRRL